MSSNSFSPSPRRAIMLAWFVTLVLVAVSGLCGCASYRALFSGDIPVAPQRFAFQVGGSTLAVPIQSSHDLENPQEFPPTLLVMLHGGGLTAHSYFRRGKAMAGQAGMTDEVMVVAPQFLEERIELDEPGTLFWDKHWREGGDSLSAGRNQGLPRVSSFTVLDALITRLTEAGRIRSVVVCGHSAGAQLALRYALLNRIHEPLRERGVHLRYVAANPSSYLYLSPARYSMDESGAIVPRAQPELEKTPGFNHYKYGLEKPVPYAAANDAATVAGRLRHRKLLVLLGGKDTKRKLFSLDMTAPAELQGRHRLERGLIYRHHLREVLGGVLPETIECITVPDAGHSATDMFLSPGIPQRILTQP